MDSPVSNFVLPFGIPLCSAAPIKEFFCLCGLGLVRGRVIVRFDRGGNGYASGFNDASSQGFALRAIP
jgi:hypothetical protein